MQRVPQFLTCARLLKGKDHHEGCAFPDFAGHFNPAVMFLGDPVEPGGVQGPCRFPWLCRRDGRYWADVREQCHDPFDNGNRGIAFQRVKPQPVSRPHRQSPEPRSTTDSKAVGGSDRCHVPRLADLGLFEFDRDWSGEHLQASQRDRMFDGCIQVAGEPGASVDGPFAAGRRECG